MVRFNLTTLSTISISTLVLLPLSHIKHLPNPHHHYYSIPLNLDVRADFQFSLSFSLPLPPALSISLLLCLPLSAFFSHSLLSSFSPSFSLPLSIPSCNPLPSFPVFPPRPFPSFSLFLTGLSAGRGVSKALPSRTYSHSCFYWPWK